MAKTYADLLQEVKAAIRQVSLEDLKDRLDSGEELILVDVREKDEWRQGHVPGALHIPRGFLEMQSGSRLPDKNAKIVTICAAGIRSAFAAKVLLELGYSNVESANPGFNQWKDQGFPTTQPFAFTDAQLNRYSRHLLLPEVGEQGQAKLLQPRALAWRRRARITGGPLPRCRRRRHDRHRRWRHRRRVEPAASGVAWP